MGVGHFDHHQLFINESGWWLTKIGCRASLMVVDGSEFSLVLPSPFGLEWERMGTAPAKGLESKQRVELKSSSK